MLFIYGLIPAIAILIFRLLMRRYPKTTIFLLVFIFAGPMIFVMPIALLKVHLPDVYQLINIDPFDSYKVEEVNAPAYAKKNLNVRKYPTTKNSILGTIKAGSSLSVNGYLPYLNWHKVSYNDETGYIYGPLVSVQK